MRRIVFDDNEVVSTNMYILDEGKENDTRSIGGGRCLYTVIEEYVSKSMEQDDLMGMMSERVKSYINKEKIQCMGEAYAIIKHVVCDEESVNAYIEVFIPIV